MKTRVIFAFPSDLGWMGLMVAGATVEGLTFGHPTAVGAEKIAQKQGSQQTAPSGWVKALIRRLQAYASGTRDDFRDVRVDLSPLSQFQRRVLTQCRRVRYGSTISYADLAAKAGHPAAARAVGNCMARNPLPLIIPCHRVVCADGRIGSYSAPGGATMKRRLLVLESAELT